MKRKLTALALAVTAAVLPFAASAAPKGRVLVVLSSEHQVQLRDDKTYESGYFLNEVVVPLRKLVDAGYEPVFANPKGNDPVMDQNSNNKLFFGGNDNKRAAALSYLQANAAFHKPQPLSAIAKKGTAEFAGIFIPGGHAPLQDLISDPSLGQVLRSFHESGKPTGIICHGPIALLAALPDTAGYRRALQAGDYQKASSLASNWAYAGYRMTVFSTAEEQAVEGPNAQLGGSLPFYAETALTQAGGRVETVGMWTSNVVEDRELLTGQQPQSDEALGNALVAKLDAAAR